ncbi:MAG: S8 family serine peptidase [Chloroflexi bacterium]|nr:S8 family serine peptidase [Chloroflexota bacterium]
MRRLLSLIIGVGMLLATGTHPLAAAEQPNRAAGAAAIADQFIISVKPGRDARGVARAANVTPTHVFSRVLNGFVATLNAGQRTALQHHPDVALVEPDQLVAATGTQSIDPTGGLWGLDRIDQRALPLSGSYTYITSGMGVTAYIIDSGVQANHPDFGARAQSAYDALGGSGADCHGHGTHLAGIIGGTTYGLAKQVKLRGVRVLDCDALGTVSNAIRGIDWVAVNAVKPAVATLAFIPINLSSSNGATLQLAVENLINAGVFVAVAAGNNNVDGCALAPANVSAAFTVAASTRTDQRYAASNYGACIDSYAPGAGITSAWINSSTDTLSGTSQATAFVAGVAALYKAIAGEATQATINSWLITNAIPNIVQGNPAGTSNRFLRWTGDPRSLSANSTHTCAVRSDSTIICWGKNDYGQTTPPSGLFTQVRAGRYHTCGLRLDGTITCWGRNDYGQATPPAGTFSQIDTGESHSCGLRPDNIVVCWGWNGYGQIVAPTEPFVQLILGGHNSCGVRLDGTVQCWGNNRYGQSSVPSITFTQFTPGGFFSCGIRPDDTVLCWGSDLAGQLSPPSGAFTYISAGANHACGLRTNSTITCWGDNWRGQAGPPSGTFTYVAAGADHTCGIRTDGTLACWGRNYEGQATPPTNWY